MKEQSSLQAPKGVKMSRGKRKRKKNRNKKKQGSKQEIASTTSSPPSSSQQVGWVKLRIPTANLVVFHPPKGWVATKKPRGAGVIIKCAAEQSATINLIISSATQEDTVESLEPQALGMPTRLKSIGMLDPSIKMEVIDYAFLGQKGKKLMYGMRAAKARRVAQLWTVSFPRKFILTYTCNISEFDKYRDTLETIVQSMRFEDLVTDSAQKKTDEEQKEEEEEEEDDDETQLKNDRIVLLTPYFNAHAGIHLKFPSVLKLVRIRKDDHSFVKADWKTIVRVRSLDPDELKRVQQIQIQKQNELLDRMKQRFMEQKTKAGSSDASPSDPTPLMMTGKSPTLEKSAPVQGNENDYAQLGKLSKAEKILHGWMDAEDHYDETDVYSSSGFISFCVDILEAENSTGDSGVERYQAACSSFLNKGNIERTDTIALGNDSDTHADVIVYKSKGKIVEDGKPDRELSVERRLYSFQHAQKNYIVYMRNVTFDEADANAKVGMVVHQSTAQVLLERILAHFSFVENDDKREFDPILITTYENFAMKPPVLFKFDKRVFRLRFKSKNEYALTSAFDVCFVHLDGDGNPMPRSVVGLLARDLPANFDSLVKTSPLDAMRDHTKKELERVIENITIIAERNVEVSGLAGREREFEAQIGVFKLKFLQRYTIMGGKSYMMMFQTAVEDYEREVSNARFVLESFKILD